MLPHLCLGARQGKSGINDVRPDAQNKKGTRLSAFLIWISDQLILLRYSQARTSAPGSH